MRVPLAEVGNRFICAKTLSKMCCLSKASSHFVVFVCENPDRKPSRKMNRLNEFQCKPSSEANLFGYAKAQPEIMKSEALNNKRLNKNVKLPASFAY